MLTCCALALSGCEEADIVEPPATFDWTFLGLADERVLSIALTPDGLFAGTRFSGVQRYLGDTSWEPKGLDHAMVGSLLYHEPTGLLFAGMTPWADETTESAIYVSADAGDSWEPRDDGIAAAEGYSSDDLGGGTRIIESLDEGETWREIEVPDEVGYFRSVLRDEDGRLYVGTDEGIWLMEPGD